MINDNEFTGEGFYKVTLTGKNRLNDGPYTLWIDKQKLANLSKDRRPFKLEKKST